MDIVLASMAALALLAAAGYVHRQLPRFTRVRAQLVMVRILLIAVGAAFGATVALQLGTGLWQVIAFAAGFGVVHVPAAVILLVKSRRGVGKS